MSTTNQTDEYDFELVRLDGQCRDILKTIRDHGGTATSKELKADAGVDKNQLHYRLDDVLADMGLVETFTARPDHGGKQLKHATFTDQGQQAIDAGLLDDILDANTGLRQIQRQVDELAETLDGKVDRWQLSRSIDDVRSQIGALHDDLEDIDATDDVNRMKTRLESLRDDVAALEESTDDIAASVAEMDDAKADSARVDRLSETVRRRIDELETEIDTADRTENIVALSRVVRELADELADQDRRSEVRQLTRRLERLDETAATSDELEAVQARVDSLDDETDRLASERRVRSLAHRLDRLERSVDGLDRQVAANTSSLADHTAYSAMTREEKRRYWIEQANERIAELGCRHERIRPGGVPSDRRKRRNLLAHLEEPELCLIREEGLFEPGDALSAKASKIPGPCEHGLIGYHLVPWRW